MPRTLVVVFCAVLILASVLVQSANAQCTPPANRTWIIVTDNGAGRDTLWFGHDAAATYGLNTALCEIELPPAPPAGVFDLRWVNIDSHSGQDTPAGLGQGFTEDYRQQFDPLPSTDIDTFRVKFQPGEGGFPFTFTWDVLGVTGICDSAILQDEFGGFLVKARMHVVNTVQVTNPAFSSLLLIRFGQKSGSSVDPVGEVLPSEFALDQNYPNPFNPSTMIQFSVPRVSQTDVAVFDILGRRVATLVSEQLAPHTYSVKWEGKNDLGVAVSSGMYLLRMSAVDESGANFTAMRKLVLMK
jgi:hypothetical protein